MLLKLSALWGDGMGWEDLCLDCTSVGLSQIGMARNSRFLDLTFSAVVSRRRDDYFISPR